MFSSKRVGVVDHKDRVLANEADEGDDPDKRKGIQGLLSEGQPSHCPDKGKWQGRDDDQRIEERLVEGDKEDVDEGDREEKRVTELGKRAALLVGLASDLDPVARWNFHRSDCFIDPFRHITQDQAFTDVGTDRERALPVGALDLRWTGSWNDGRNLAEVDLSTLCRANEGHLLEKGDVLSSVIRQLDTNVNSTRGSGSLVATQGCGHRTGVRGPQRLGHLASGQA